MTFHPTKRTRPRTWFLTFTAAAVAASPVGCADEFSSCEDTLTCEEQGGEGGAVGEAGEGGGGASSGAGGSVAGEASGGHGNAAGNGGDGSIIEDLSVLDVSPANGTEAVERDAQVVISFSADVDPSSIDPSSIAVTSAQGAVAGTLDVNGSRVTFTPNGPLPLLTTISVQITEDVKGTSGAALSGAFMSEFSVKEGRFGTPQQILDTVNDWVFSANDRGVVLATGGLFDEPAQYAAMFEPESLTWSEPEVIANVPSVYEREGAIDATGNAIALFSQFQRGGGWNRYTFSEGWAEPHSPTVGPAADPVTEEIALLDSGEAIWVRWPYTGPLSMRSLAPLESAWAAPQQLAAAATGFWALESLGDRVLAVYAENDTVMARIVSPEMGASAPRALGVPGEYPSKVSVDAQGGRAVVSLFSQRTGVRSSVYDGAAWSAVTRLTAAYDYDGISTIAGDYSLVTWFVPGSETDTRELRTRRYSEPTGWTGEFSLGVVTTPFDHAAAIDGNGAALVAWADGNGVTYRRLREGSWGPVRYIEAPGADATDQVHAFGSTGGDILLIWRSRSGAVWASRFE